MTVSSPRQANSLPALLYLLSIDLDKAKVPDRRKTGYVLRAAALIELGLHGKVADVRGKAHVTDAGGTGDPVLDRVLGEIARDRDRKWEHWVRRNGRDTLDAVERQLVSAGAITVRKRTFLADRVNAVRAASIGQLRQRILNTLRGDQPVETLDPYDAALTALAANGELSKAIPRKERKAHKDRVAALTDHLGASAPALKNLVDELYWRRWSPAGSVAAANAR
jgi:hypothetical protein